MILVAVIVGYILGVMPFILLKVIENKRQVVERESDKENQKNQTDILSEWLNGPEKPNKINQEDILDEYLTGEMKKGE